MSSWVYKRTEPGLWTVGYNEPSGEWNPESDWGSAREAAERCHWLNGGQPPSDAPASVPDETHGAGATSA